MSGFSVPDLRGAACADRDPDLFFPAPNAKATRAKAVCRGCPSRLPCLEYILDNPSTSGVWGGFSESDRLHWLGRLYRAGAHAADIIAVDDAEHDAKVRRLADAAEARAERKRERDRERRAAERRARASQEVAA